MALFDMKKLKEEADRKRWEQELIEQQQKIKEQQEREEQEKIRIANMSEEDRYWYNLKKLEEEELKQKEQKEEEEANKNFYRNGLFDEYKLF